MGDLKISIAGGERLAAALRRGAERVQPVMRQELNSAMLTLQR